MVDGPREGGAEAGGVGAAVGVCDCVCEAEDLLVVAVVVLEHDINEHVILDFDLVFIFEGDLSFS